MSSDIFFHGLAEGETAEIALGEGITLVIKLVEIRSADREGNRQVTFDVNGMRRSVKVADKAAVQSVQAVAKPLADLENPYEIGANIPGLLVKILVKEGDKVTIYVPDHASVYDYNGDMVVCEFYGIQIMD